MTTYNTGNPIGSTDPRDLYDNAQNMDNLGNGTAPSYPDRLGVERKSWAGMEQDFDEFLASSGYQFLGDYSSSIEATAYNQIIREAGEFWRAAASATLPYTTTGAGMPEGGAFVSVGDAVLRQELAGNPADGLGAALVNGSVIRVTSIASMEAYSAPVGYVFSLNAGGRSGVFDVVAGDFSAELAADSENGIYVGLADNPTATNKVLRRRYSGFIFVEWFGAEEVADSADAINTAAAFCGDGVELRSGINLDIYSDVTLRFINVDFSDLYINCFGSSKIVIGGNANNPVGVTQKIKSVTRSGGATIVPSLQVRGSKGCHFFVNYCDYLQLYADTDLAGDPTKDSSIAYSSFTLGYILKLEITNNPASSGSPIQWINENTFYLNRVVNLIMSGTYQHNHNHFFRGNFEGSSINFETGQHNYVHDIRGEFGLTINFSQDTSDNVILFGWISSGSRYDSLPSVTDNGRFNVVKHLQYAYSEEKTLFSYDYQTLLNTGDAYNLRGISDVTIGADSLSAGTFRAIYTSPKISAFAEKVRFKAFLEGKISGGIRISVDGYDSSGVIIPSTGEDVYFDGAGAKGFGVTDNTSATVDGRAFWLLNKDAVKMVVKVIVGSAAAEFEGFTLSAMIFDPTDSRAVMASFGAETPFTAATFAGNSAATTVAQIVADYNALLGSLRTAGLIST